MATAPLRLSVPNSFASSSRTASIWAKFRIRFFYPPIMSAHPSMDGGNKVHEERGLFSLKRKIEDAVSRSETFTPTALEIEEDALIKQEEMIREHNLWDNPVKSNEILSKLAGSAKLVDSLKETEFKAEEAKLISILMEKEVISHHLFMQAYDTSMELSRFLDHYEISKLLKGPYDVEGACVTIKAGSKTIISEMWAEQVLCMYAKWAAKQGYKGRMVNRCTSKSGGITSATIEFEYEYAYGYLSGERGVHCMLNNQDGSDDHLAGIAAVDVIPLFLGKTDLQIDDKDLIISSSASSVVCIQHLPTGISVESSGERSQFGNKMKALNRLKAKLVVSVKEQGGSGSRKYRFQPYKMVEDVKTGLQLADIDSVLDGNIGPLIVSHIEQRWSLDFPCIT